MGKHTAVYLRVSTRGQNLESQKPDLERWAAGRAPVVWYRDTFSGKTMDRPKWNRLWDEVLAGRVSEIVVWRLDRLGRTAKGLTAVFDELVKRKVNLVSLKDGVDLSTAAGRLMANVLASVAAYETEVRGERVQAGLDVARAKGVTLGRPPGTGKPLKVTAAHRGLIARLKSEGQGVTSIKRLTGLSRQTIYDVLNLGPDGGGPR